MKLYNNKRTLYFTMLLILLVAAFLLYWKYFSHRVINAKITSSNGSMYAIDLPSDFEPASFTDVDSLKYQPSLEYESKPKDLHIMIIDDSKAKILSFGLDYDLDTYMKIASRSIDSAGMHLNKSITINGNNAIQTEIRGKSKGVEMVYDLTCIETQKYFYQVLIWSSEDKYNSNKDDMSAIINSFKEQ
ncbi:MAG TPA: hypothetical protein VL651_02930 [Bacteroidia bacterium]|nr:hypothetical protein [Bacteroidia bacterium]